MAAELGADRRRGACRRGPWPTPSRCSTERWSPQGAFRLNPRTGGVSGGLLLLAVARLRRPLWTKGRDRRFVGSDIDQVMGNPGGEDQRVPLIQGGASAPVEFAPPDDLRPGQVGTLIDEQANTLDVTATIVDLAVRGFLLIQEIPKEGFFGKPDWTLIKLEKATDELLPYEEKLLDGLFHDGTEVTMSSLRTTFVARLDERGERAVRGRDQAQVVLRASRQGALDAGWSGASSSSSPAVPLTFALARWTHWGLVGLPVVLFGLLLMFGAGRMPARTRSGPRHAHAGPRVPHGDREGRDEHVAVGRAGERLHAGTCPTRSCSGAPRSGPRRSRAWPRSPTPPGTCRTIRSSTRAFAHSIDGFAVATGGTIASTPAGSGSSGLGGGGFSGGGGGGGGGGSW